MKNTTHKHTPGPFHITKNTIPGQFVTDTKIRDVGNSVIAVLHINAEGNAPLLSAAPELLQVARDFILLAALHDWDGAAIDFARATVAKAEGMK
jgi:hypothetical protein